MIRPQVLAGDDGAGRCAMPAVLRGVLAGLVAGA